MLKKMLQGWILQRFMLSLTYRLRKDVFLDITPPFSSVPLVPPPPPHLSLPPPSHRRHLQLQPQQQKWLPVCSASSLWPQTSPSAPGRTRAQAHSRVLSVIGITVTTLYKRSYLEERDSTLTVMWCDRADTDLRRWEACGHAVAQGRGDEVTAQDGAHVVRHDLLLLHAAVVLQGDDHWVVWCLRMAGNKIFNQESH